MMNIKETKNGTFTKTFINDDELITAYAINIKINSKEGIGTGTLICNDIDATENNCKDKLRSLCISHKEFDLRTGTKDPENIIKEEILIHNCKIIECTLIDSEISKVNKLIYKLEFDLDDFRIVKIGTKVQEQ